MSTVPSAPAMPGPAARPLLALDRDELRLSSPRGEAAGGAVTLTNRGDAWLEGLVAPRIGGDWLRVEPVALRLAPGESCRVRVRADPATLAAGYTRGEIEIVTNGGEATVSVRIGVRTGRSWRLLAAAIVASAAAAGVVGLLLSGVKIPASAPAAPAPARTAQQHHVGRPSPTATPRPSFDKRAALADIRAAIIKSNAVWQAALTSPSTADLGTVKTGADLAADIAAVEDLLAGGEHWQIALQRFAVLSVQVSADGTSGQGEVEKTERRALYGPGHTRAPYELSDDTYKLRYSLVFREGRWLVSTITVESITPLLGASGPPLTVEQVAARVLPAVVHVEADSSGGYAVGTGIIIRSTAARSYIITNDHVVTGANTVKLQRWISGEGYVPASPWVASKVWEDSTDDLAVIRIDQGGLPVATWGNSNTLPPGAAVVAIGYAENLAGGPTVTDGIVSSLQRTSPDNPNGPTYIGHSATINHGNSGGPLLDMNGRVIGINTWTLNNTQGLFFAIPSSRAIRVAAGFIGSNG